MADKLFGTDGVRGVANVFPMVPDFAMKLAMACAVTICTNHRKVAIAKDTRISGDMLEAALIAGFTASGVEVVSLGVLPTPALTMLTPELKVDMSVMITASHNPYHDNGIKLIGADGNKLSDAQTSRIETLVAENAFTLNPDALGRVQFDNTAIARYEQKIKSLFQGSPLKNMKIVLDCANGAFAAFAPELLRSLGAEVIAIGNAPDGCNINMGCGSTATQLMQETVVSTNSDMGIALDGDGDRIIVCDEKGNRLDGDQILAFVATYLHQHNLLKANSVVATVWSNLGLEKYLQTLGIKYFRTAVGERHVTEKMREIGSNFGGASIYASTGSLIYPAIQSTYAAFFVGGVSVRGNIDSDSCASKSFRYLKSRNSDGSYTYYEGSNWGDGEALNPDLDKIRLIVRGGIIVGYTGE